MRNKKSKSTAWRLIGYAWKYKWRFSFGVIAGGLVGLSIFGMLDTMGDAFNPQKAIAKKEIVQESRGEIVASKVELNEHVESHQKEASLNKSVQIKESDTSEKLAEGEEETEVSKKLKYYKMVLNWFGYEVENPDGTVTLACTILIVLSFPFFMAIKGLFTYFNRYYMRWVGTRSIADIRNDLFQSLSNQSLSFYSKSEVGQLISRINNDTGIAEQLLSSSVADLTRGPMEILACFSFIVYKAIELEIYSVSLAFVIAAPLCIFPIIILGRKIKKITRKSLTRISLLTSHMLETFTGIRVVKAYHMEAAELQRFEANNDEYVGKVVQGLKYELMITPVMEFVGVLIICSFLVYTYVQGLSLEDIAPFGVAAGLAYQPLKRIGKVLANMQRSLTGAERAFNYIDLIPDLVETEGAMQVNEFNDKFDFNNVSFQYDKDGPKIIDDLSLEIKKGEMVAFVGETGSGKTTISNLLARFYDPTSGSITIDGLDLRKVKIESLRNLIGVVTQDTIIFNDTVAYNIAYGTEGVTQEQIEDAAKKANAHEFILEKEYKYETICGEKGFNLSGGQKQRISIARAILKNPPILILDEATSALDTVTEQLVQEALNNLMGNRTVFAIAHRLSTIKHADKICVLEQGRIVEFGSHDELYAQKGKYRKLCDMQFS